jgi:hypothetical protein
MRDPALIEEVGKSGVDIDPLPGAELQRVVDATFRDRSRRARARQKAQPAAIVVNVPSSTTA